MHKVKNIGNKLLTFCKHYSAMKNYSSLSSIIDIHPEVKDQLRLKKPIVALESTIITHGMPNPYNLETALDVENIVRKEGSIPATIAIIDGRIKIGLTEDQLKRLASNCDTENIIKCSRRDIGYVLSKKISGGTTVAGTLIIANMVGIKIFATGGIGGVHRDGHNTLDISADLIELGKTPIAVISSGIKSILDIPRTLEYLETNGVCVATYKCSNNDFPAFYTRSSGCKVPYNLNNSTEAAKLIKSYIDINLMSGILIGVPIPKENAISDKLINDAIENALDEAKNQNIFGKEMTPFVLEAVAKITKGKSLDTNMALIKNNARVASKIAVKLYNMLENNNNNNNKDSNEKFNINKDQLENIKLNDQYNNNNNVPVVIGASILDMCMTVKDEFKELLFIKKIPNIPEENISVLYGGCDFVEKFLENNLYMIGNSLTVADICCVTSISSMQILAPITEDRYPKVSAWLKRMTQLPYYKEINEKGVKELENIFQTRIKSLQGQ